MCRSGHHSEDCSATRRGNDVREHCRLADAHRGNGGRISGSNPMCVSTTKCWRNTTTVRCMSSAPPRRPADAALHVERMAHERKPALGGGQFLRLQRGGGLLRVRGLGEPAGTRSAVQRLTVAELPFEINRTHQGRVPRRDVQAFHAAGLPSSGKSRPSCPSPPRKIGRSCPPTRNPTEVLPPCR